MEIIRLGRKCLLRGVWFFLLLSTEVFGQELPALPTSGLGSLIRTCNVIELWGGRSWYPRLDDFEDDGRDLVLGIELTCGRPSGFELALGTEYLDANEVKRFDTFTRKYFLPVRGFYLGSSWYFYEKRLYLSVLGGYYSLLDARLSQSDRPGQMALSGKTFGGRAALGWTYPIVKVKRKGVGVERKIKKQRLDEEREIITESSRPVEAPDEERPEETKWVEKIWLGVEVGYRYLKFNNISQNGTGGFGPATASEIGAPDSLDYSGFFVIGVLSVDLFS